MSFSSLCELFDRILDICGVEEDTVFGLPVFGLVKIFCFFIFLSDRVILKIGKAVSKVCSTKKPWNPTVPLALPVAPELSALCVIRPPALKGGKNISTCAVGFFS